MFSALSRRPHVSLVALLCALCAWTWQPAHAASFTANGISFSDEGGGFRLKSVSGSGSRTDPFVVVEEFIGPSAAVMVIRGLAGQLAGHRDTAALRAAGFSLRKVVVNLSGASWQLFDMELREERDLPSDYHDGLSFDQIRSAPRPFRADRFALSREVEEPFDYVRFSQGTVHHGETVVFEVTVTDTSPRNQFFLIQRPRRPIAGGPPLRTRRIAANR